MSSFTFENWTLFPFDADNLIKKYSIQKIDELSGSDVERIENKDPAIVLIAQRNHNNHSFKIYFDAAFGYINRHILTIDDTWAQVLENFSSLMAFADYVAGNEEYISQLQNDGMLQISWLKDECLHCKY